MVEGAVERVDAIDQRAVAQLPSLVHGNRQTGVGIDVRVPEVGRESTTNAAESRYSQPETRNDW